MLANCHEVFQLDLHDPRVQVMDVARVVVERMGLVMPLIAVEALPD